MAGANLASELICYSLADREDDAAIRSLLRKTPMGGGISLSMRQEPNYFTESNHMPGRQHTIVAKTGETLVAVGSCAIRPRYVNGELVDVGYLRTLRLVASMAGRFDLLRRGYRFLRSQWEEWGAPYLFTSIAAENERAIRFLERSLPGMPRYRFLSEFVTLMLPVPQPWREGLLHFLGYRADCAISSVPGSAEALPSRDEIAEFLSSNPRSLSPAWSSASLQKLEALNLRAGDFVVLREGRRIVACAAVWDQRQYKQTVIHRYGSREKVQKRVFNWIAPFLRQPRMPAEGTVCPFGMASHFVTEPAFAEKLVRSLLAVAAAKGIQFLCLGFAQNDPVLREVRARFFSHIYRSRLYQVDWPDLRSAPINLEGLSPEIALL